MTKRTLQFGSENRIYDDSEFPKGLTSVSPIAVGAPVDSGDAAQKGGTAPINEAFVTIGNSATLTNERALAVGNSLTLSDGGAGNSVTLDTIQDIRTTANIVFTSATLGSSNFTTTVPLTVSNNYTGGGTPNTKIRYGLFDTSAAGRTAAYLIIGQEQEWTSTSSTRDAYFSIELLENGSLTEKFRINSDGTIVLANVNAGTDNTVLVYNGSNQIVSDEIDSRVWGSSLVDGSGASTQIAYWSDSNTLTGDANFTWDGTTLTAVGNAQIVDSSAQDTNPRPINIIKITSK